MEPAWFGLAFVGATILLTMIVAWASLAAWGDRWACPPPRSRRWPQMTEETRYVCPLCGVSLPSGQEAGCPVIEAFGFVMAESNRSGAEGPTPL
jgi:hypothetical protein